MLLPPTGLGKFDRPGREGGLRETWVIDQSIIARARILPDRWSFPYFERREFVPKKDTHSSELTELENDEENKVEGIEEVTEEHRIANVLLELISHISSIDETLPLIISSIFEDLKKCIDEFKEFKDKYIHGDDDLEPGQYFVQLDKYHEFQTITKQMKNRALALTTVPSSFLVSLISQYDAFLGHLIREILLVQPELLISSDRNLTFNQLAQFNSMEDAKDWILEKEVETVIRQSHCDHFEWMEKKFGLPLRKDLEVWPLFIEATERRNLFVHTGGLISSQYINVCKKHEVVHNEEPIIGQRLSVSPGYVGGVYRVIFEIGFKLAHVLWRKFQPEAIKFADDNLIELGYDKLFEEDYHLTKIIFDFALSVFKTFSNDQNRRLMVVNCALAYKWSGENEHAIEIIKAEDWSACRPKFRLAEAVILENYENAVQIMIEIGDDEKEVAKDDYRHWPLFKNFRQVPEFLDAHEKIFDEKFTEAIIDEEEIPTSDDEDFSINMEAIT